MARKILIRHDDPERWEYPDAFDYASANARFLLFASALDKEFGTHFKTETGNHIQDASFHSQIYFSVGLARFYLIRFSNFGDMVAINDDLEIPVEVLSRVKKLFVEHKYSFISCEELETSYTGANPGVTGIDSWWTRYFDWV